MKGTINGVLQGVRPDQGPFQGAVFAQDSSPGSTPVSICDFINLTN
jgi:hypothetical protein